MDPSTTPASTWPPLPSLQVTLAGKGSSPIFRLYPITPACSLCFEQHLVHTNNTDSTFLNLSKGISLIKYPQEI